MNDRFNYICQLDKVYDKTNVPGLLPLHLNLWIQILDVTEINEIEHSITIFLRLHVFWNDPGISYRNQTL